MQGVCVKLLFQVTMNIHRLICVPFTDIMIIVSTATTLNSHYFYTTGKLHVISRKFHFNCHSKHLPKLCFIIPYKLNRARAVWRKSFESKEIIRAKRNYSSQKKLCGENLCSTKYPKRQCININAIHYPIFHVPIEYKRNSRWNTETKRF